ncbi:MAG TPA: methyltransferase domain-containing protein [Candidatus Paceibacterota bacterium]|nr:methyltransferase domain-containing protein [Candidatus Paceibacterota bacterium]
MNEKKDTSWKKVAGWYDKTVKEGDSYQIKVIYPNLSRWIPELRGKKAIDVGCGQGFFSRFLAEKGASVTGVDSADTLIQIAKKESKNIKYIKADAQNLSFAKAGEFDMALCVLSLQNMENLKAVLGEISRVLKPGGKLVAVLNHPAFRIPQSTSWGFDEKENIQYRRIDSYLSSSKNKIDMYPSRKEKKIYTYSFHHSLQDYVKALSSSSLAIVKLEEWISHRKSEPGPKAKAEDTARKEIPIFMAFEAVKLPK